jgi:hypothetical protein
MEGRSQFAFALVILVQAAHSIEEYVFRLFEVFAPARWVSGLFSTNPAAGFALANVAIVLFGVWCYWARVRPAHASARGYAWFWVCLELANGVGHLIQSAVRGGYFPGVGTAPLLIAASFFLAFTLTRSGRVT